MSKAKKMINTQGVQGHVLQPDLEFIEFNCVTANLSESTVLAPGGASVVSSLFSLLPTYATCPGSMQPIADTNPNLMKLNAAGWLEASLSIDASVGLNVGPVANDEVDVEHILCLFKDGAAFAYLAQCHHGFIVDLTTSLGLSLYEAGNTSRCIFFYPGDSPGDGHHYSLGLVRLTSNSSATASYLLVGKLGNILIKRVSSMP